MHARTHARTHVRTQAQTHTARSHTRTDQKTSADMQQLVASLIHPLTYASMALVKKLEMGLPSCNHDVWYQQLFGRQWKRRLVPSKPIKAGAQLRSYICRYTIRYGLGSTDSGPRSTESPAARVAGNSNRIQSTADTSNLKSGLKPGDFKPELGAGIWTRKP